MTSTRSEIIRAQAEILRAFLPSIEQMLLYDCRDDTEEVSEPVDVEQEPQTPSHGSQVLQKMSPDIYRDDTTRYNRYNHRKYHPRRGKQWERHPHRFRTITT